MKSESLFNLILGGRGPASKIWTPVGLRRVVLGGRGNAKSLKCFGGPGEIRTHDLFHAMEAVAMDLRARSLIPLDISIPDVVGSGTDSVLARDRQEGPSGGPANS